METEDCPHDHLDCRHQAPVWQSRITLITAKLGFLITCDMHLMPMGEFLEVAKLMQKAALDYLKEEGIIIETRLPPLKLVKG